jgi:hypothetical protein
MIGDLERAAKLEGSGPRADLALDLLRVAGVLVMDASVAHHCGAARGTPTTPWRSSSERIRRSVPTYAARSITTGRATSRSARSSNTSTHQDVRGGARGEREKETRSE